MALSNVGESEIIYCDECKYAADEEKATSHCISLEQEEMLDSQIVDTPNVHSVEEVSSFLNVIPAKIVKTIVYYAADVNEYGAFLVRGDCEVNEVKVANALNSSEAFIRLASDKEIIELGSMVGFIGPVGLNQNIKVFIDEEVTKMQNFVVGANLKDKHIINVNFDKDFTGEVRDIKKSKAGDLCPVCGKPLKSERGIEVGQIFKLQTKYSEPMGCTYLDEKGITRPMVMGCYGIGVTRTFASIVEQYHDEFGIKFPLQVAPYHAVVIPVNYDDENQRALADKIHDELLNAGVEVVEDDRPLKPGFKFKDWELIGIPNIIVVGRRAGEGIVEYKNRQDNIKNEMSASEATNIVIELVKNIK